MNLIQKPFFQWLSLAIGKTLINISALAYYYLGEEPDDISIEEISLQFNDLESGRIFCGSDGESICWENNSYSPFSMGEYGEVIVLDLNSDKFWQNFVNRKLEKAYFLESDRGRSICGVQLVFEEGVQVVIVNLGDDMYIYPALPQVIVEEEEIKFLDAQEFADESV